MAQPSSAEIAQALTDYQADSLIEPDSAATVESRHKDRLASFATMAEAYNTAWATMTNAQRRAEVVRLAGRWDQQRRWVERNYAFMPF